MSNLGEQATAILDELHTERLAYESEYVPLADAANLLTAYEEIGMTPEDITKLLTQLAELAERIKVLETENATLRKMQPVQLDDTGAQSLELAAEVSALRQKVSALRPVSREQVEKVWKGEWEHPGYYDDGGSFVHDCSKCNTPSTDEYWFCPYCGAPMTDEAVEIVMERMETINNA